MKVLYKVLYSNKSFVVFAAMLQILILGVLDYSTGFELSFSVFYLIPIATVAWLTDRRSALGIALLSAVTWQFANYAAGEQLSHPMIQVWNASTRFTFFIIVSLLLSKIRESLERETAFAREDFLTGASNPRSFFETAQAEINRCRRYERYLSVVYVDADNLKAINDTFGHRAGSDLLIKFVEIVKENLRASDMIARLGGDEFVILLPETNSEQAQQVTNKLRERLAAEFITDGPPTTFSMGVVSCAVPPETVDEMVKMADNLMYEVKKSGKNSVRFRDMGHGDYFEQQDSIAVLSRKIFLD